MTEEELREAIAKSQKDGFQLLFQQYQRYVYTIIWNGIRAVGSPEDAEEILSDCFTDVFRHYSAIQEGSLKAYIGTVARHKALKAFHRLSGQCDTLPLGEAENTAAASDPETDTELAAQNRLLFQKIRELGQPDSTIIIQKYYYDRNAGEIAESLHMKPAAVRKRLSRALQRLRNMLHEEDFTL